MKKISILFFLALTFTSSLFAQQERDQVFQVLNVAITNMTGSTTNTTPGLIFNNYQDNVPFRIWVKAEGNAGTTNTASSTSNLVVHISTASGSQFVTNSFDTGILSPIKLTVPRLQTATNVVSDYFELRGARYFRVGAIENNYVGTVSNIQVIVGYPK